MDANETTLHQSFRNGTLPNHLDGFYQGKLVYLRTQTPFESLAGVIAKLWLPWYGKVFQERKQRGYNVISPRIAPFLRFRFGEQIILGQNNRGICVFPFKTRAAKGLSDPLSVFQLDYNLPENPARVRTVIDELVATGDGKYLGKAYIRGNHETRFVAFFSLQT